MTATLSSLFLFVLLGAYSLILSSIRYSNVIQEDYDYICFYNVYCDTMGVQKDAGELLLFSYDELIKHGKTSLKTQDVLEATKWDKNRIMAAYTFLKGLNLLKSFLSRGEDSGLDITKNFYVMGLKPKGINIVENEEQFEKTFSFKANLASLKFSWN